MRVQRGKLAVRNDFTFDFSGPIQSQDCQVDALVLQVLLQHKGAIEKSKEHEYENQTWDSSFTTLLPNSMNSFIFDTFLFL